MWPDTGGGSFTFSTANTTWSTSNTASTIDQLVPVVHIPPVQQPKTALDRLSERIDHYTSRVAA